MRPQENIVRLIIKKHVEVLEVCRLASGIGVQIEILEKLDLLDLAMDIIGYPPTNVDEFDVNLKDNGVSMEPHKRKDFENMFDREFYMEGEWDLGKNEIDVFVERLYRDFDELILTKPHLFVQSKD